MNYSLPPSNSSLDSPAPPGAAVFCSAGTVRPIWNREVQAAFGRATLESSGQSGVMAMHLTEQGTYTIAG